MSESQGKAMQSSNEGSSCQVSPQTQSPTDVVRDAPRMVGRGRGCYFTDRHETNAYTDKMKTQSQPIESKPDDILNNFATMKINKPA